MAYQLQYLRGIRLKTFLAIADRIIPEDERSPGGGTMATAGLVDKALGRLPEDLRKKILLFLVVIEVFGFFVGLKGFHKLSDEKQDALLRKLENHPIKLFRMGFFGLKTYVCMGYYTRDEIWPTINYAGPIVQREFADTELRQLAQEKLEVRS